MWLLNLVVIFLGYVVILSTIGHLFLIIFVAVPITRVFDSFELLKLYSFRKMKKNIFFDLYFLSPFILCVSIFIIAIFLCWYFFPKYILFFIIGYVLGFLHIIYNFLVGKLYSPNNINTFRGWYLNNHKKYLNKEMLCMMNLEEEDVLFEWIKSWLNHKGCKGLNEVRDKLK